MLKGKVQVTSRSFSAFIFIFFACLFYSIFNASHRNGYFLRITDSRIFFFFAFGQTGILNLSKHLSEGEYVIWYGMYKL